MKKFEITLQKDKKEEEGDLMEPSFSHGENNVSDDSINRSVIQLAARKYAGKLLLKTEIDLPKPIFNHLCRAGYFTKTRAIKRQFLFLVRCLRCGNRNSGLFRHTPCHDCGQEHLYCRNCIQLGKIMECVYLYEWCGQAYEGPIHDHPLSWKGNLTTEQRKVSKQLIQTIKNQEHLLVWAVTGSGKTEMLFESIAHIIKQGKRACIATPRTDVVRELFPRIQEAFQSTSIQALYGGSRDKDGTAQIILATTHQLLRFKHAFDLLIIDEVDAFPFHQDKTLQYAANRSIKPGEAIIYLTATPRESQLRKMYTNRLNYVFVPLRFHHHLIPTPQLTYSGELEKVLDEHILPRQFQSWLLKRKKKTRQLLIFVPTIKLAVKLEGHVKAVLRQTATIDDEKMVISVTAEDKQREEKIKAFRKKTFYCMITTTILERGVTFPSIDVAVLHANHIVFDEQALIQITGRAGRSKDDPTGEVVFFHKGQTKAMKNAVRTIKWMNRKALEIVKDRPESVDRK